MALYPESQIPYAHAWAAISQRKLGDRLGAIVSSRKGMPYGAPADLWTGLDYDWEFVDEVDPLRAAVGLVYVEEYDRVRQLLADEWDAAEPGAAGANDLNYLVNRGVLEALSGNFELALEFFEKAQLLTVDVEGGLFGAKITMNVLEWSRQSEWPIALLLTYRETGQHEKADVIARQFEAWVAEYIAAIAEVSDLADHNYLYARAQFYAIEGRTDEALGMLRTWADQEVDIFTYIKWDPFLENLRGDPEFEAIVAEVEAALARVRAQHHAKQAALAGASRG